MRHFDFFNREEPTMAAKKKGRTMKGKVTTKTMMAHRKVMPVVKDPLTKGGLARAIVGMTGLTKKCASEVIDALGTIIEMHVKPRGPGVFTLPGLLKIKVVNKPARPARKGINPFTGEEIMFKAKPAHKVVKIKALRKLKETAAHA